MTFTLTNSSSVLWEVSARVPKQGKLLLQDSPVQKQNAAGLQRRGKAWCCRHAASLCQLCHQLQLAAIFSPQLC